VKLGNPNGAKAFGDRRAGNKKAVIANRAAAQARAEAIQAIVDECREEGSVRQLADCLNERGIVTPRGGMWHPTSVVRLPERLA
jgi:hypothetical protein